MNKTILIIGDCCDDKWIGGFLRNCSFHKEGFEVYCANTNYSTQYFMDYNLICKRLFIIKKNAPLFLYKLPVIRRLLYFIDIRILLLSIFKQINYFHIINVHYVIPELATVKLCEHANSLILTPWGSDILRRSKIELYLMKKIFNKSQYITIPETRFRVDVKTIFQQSDSKFVDVGMGTDMIDYIIKNDNYTKDQAKKDLGLDERYIIVCGYNAHPEQNHCLIINAIHKIKDKLPSNVVLIFPMTYGARQPYKETVKQYVKSLGIDAVFFEKFLTQQELLTIRKGADVFIHAQKTDNNSGSLAEHLLCGTKVINASWLKYPQYESFGTPYYEFQSFEELPVVLLGAISDKDSITKPKLKEYIRGGGWGNMSLKWCKLFKSVSM